MKVDGVRTEAEVRVSTEDGSIELDINARVPLAPGGVERPVTVRLNTAAACGFARDLASALMALPKASAGAGGGA